MKNKPEMDEYEIRIKPTSPKINEFPNGIIITCYGEERAREFCERNKDYYYTKKGEKPKYDRK